ncbi:hypothetical protein QQZ08_000477 [Neonectria magnoliae]|uniref:Major facilitator superfamily (MFS) profile domain-containing protein n=1 Tax=Neonectria magnoliae TaxID=2732573 RepID=A0ABR1IK42_9HYPO
MATHMEDTKDPKSAQELPAKDEEHYVASEDVLKGAPQATDDEHAMTLLEGLRLVAAVLKRYGKLQHMGEYEIPASLQAGVSNGVSAGQIIGLLLNGILADWLGYRIVMLARAWYNVGVLVYGQLDPKSGFFYGGAMAIGLVWAYFRLPETKNRTFAEINILFENNVAARDFKKKKVNLNTQTVVDKE